MRHWWVGALVLSLAAGASAQDVPEEREPEFGVRGTVELGFLAVLDHDIRLGSDGSDIDYPSDLLQSNLYFVPRLSIELDIWRQHHLTFLDQPLDITSTAVLPRMLSARGRSTVWPQD